MINILNSFDLYDFSDHIIDETFKYEDDIISVFAKYEQARHLIRELLRYEDSILDGIEIQSGDCNGYKDEYVVEVYVDDGYLHIGCEPAKRDDKYKNFEGNTAYIFGDCNSRILKSCNYKRIFEVCFRECENLEENFEIFWKIFGI